MTISLSLEAVDDLTMHALMACDTSKSNARSVTNSVVASEADGVHSHGLARLPTYCEHVMCGKIDGNATPSCEQVAAGALRVDARDGFAHPAIDLGLEKLISMAEQNAIGAMAVTNSYNNSAGLTLSTRSRTNVRLAGLRSNTVRRRCFAPLAPINQVVQPVGIHFRYR